ncbi:MAG: transcriptional regulator, RpiR family [Jatrophihabitans sp.]|nr:transcriptional regulator, RpiR family [Jatrophihabitans sp.]
MTRKTNGASSGRSKGARAAGAPDVLVRIRAAWPNLAPSERRVAEVALADPTRSAAQTVTELARSTGTSQATVVRFAQRLGYSGYPELRLALAAAAGAERANRPETVPGTDISAKDDIATVIAKVGHLEATAVRETVGQLNPDALSAAVDAVVAAPRIDVYGVGASAVVALDLQMKLHRIGRFTQAWSDYHLALVSAALLKRRDVAIAISHSGTTRETVGALQEAAARKATTVAITNFPDSPLAEAADIVLTTAARETALRSGAVASRIAALIVVDCLFEAVAQRNLPATRRALQRTLDAVSERARHD